MLHKNSNYDFLVQSFFVSMVTGMGQKIPTPSKLILRVRCFIPGKKEITLCQFSKTRNRNCAVIGINGLIALLAAKNSFVCKLP